MVVKFLAFAALAVVAAGCAHDPIDVMLPPLTCGAGTFLDADGVCTPSGIQGCAAQFVEPDGVCRPSPDKCPAGTIPRFAEGCVPAGIPDCAGLFLEADGLCHPATAKCPAGTIAIPQEGCVPIDGPAGCGAGTWGNLAGTPGTIYVDPTAAPGGSGTMASPAASLAEAIGLAGEGGRIALAAGAYHEALHLTQAITIEGRCASMVRLDGAVATPYFDAIVWVDGAANVTLRGMEIGGPAVGIYADEAPALTIDEVVVRKATDQGILIGGAASEASIRHVLVDATIHGEFGGLRVDSGARATIEASAFTANTWKSLQLVGDGTDVTLRDCLVERGAPGPGGSLGFGLDVVAGAHVAVIASALRRNRDVALNVLHDGTTVELTDSIIDQTQPASSDHTGGRGMFAYYGPSVTLTGNAIVGNTEVAVMVGGSVGHSVTFVATGNLIADTASAADTGYAGRGLDIEDEVTATLTGNTVVRNRDTALFVSGAAQVTADGNIFSTTAPEQSDGLWGFGVTARRGATLALTSSLVQGAHAIGIFVDDARASIDRSLVTDTLEGQILLFQAPGLSGYAADGIVAINGANADLTSTRVQGCPRAGLFYDDSTGTLRGVFSTQNAFGLATQGDRGPDAADPSNLFTGNDKDRVTVGNLPIPDGPSEIPAN